MKINYSTYRDKVYACWIGKNIGGTMGTPYEGKRQMNDIKGFVTKPKEVLANDDLDLQLVWLHAVERHGLKAIDSKILAEYWISYIGPHWNEYGIGKANLKEGLLPPLSGDAYNDWKNSNGAWIRTEVWATLAPACPDVAMKYAYEDASVDHGTAEGTIAAMFVAALESAAFVLTDLKKLIKLALSKIPPESRMAKSVVKVLECYDSGMDYREARETIRLLNADIGDGWFEAPSNVSYALIGLLWGEGDFKKSLIYAINCGDDTDCTGATVGSVLGIMYGTAGIPEDWRAYIGDDIVTISIMKGSTFFPQFPTTCTALTDRIVKAAATVPILFNQDISFTDGETEVTEEEIVEMFAPSKKKYIDSDYVSPDEEKLVDELVARRPYSYTINSAFISATVSFDSDPDINPLESINLHLRLRNNVYFYGNMPYNLRFRWLGAEEFSIEGPGVARVLHSNSHSNCITELDFTVTASENIASKNRFVLEIEAEGRPTVAYVPVTLFKR